MVKLTIKPEANQIIHQLQAHGFEAFAVGGCVRNALLGLCPHDWDICTNAKPEEMRAVFCDHVTHDFGLKHGTLVVMVGEEPYEVTTYRVDGVYADNRHPEQVSFTDDLALDLSRRDFTVNAMAYNDEQGFFDPFGGREDLKNGLLRCVGDPDKRFREDSLRILRGVRFAATYG
ncbi:MAG: polynucleotide adenylyltransferase, partial [Ruminococcus sp.]|nr:polynucleotide adenylyltransferase [Ruminococcus sp.]